MFKTHYRLPFNIKEELLEETKTLDEKIQSALKQANLKIQLANLKSGQITKDTKINEIMDEDFNTPNLITYLIDLIKQLNSAMRANLPFIEIYDKIILIVNILGLHYDLQELSVEDKDLYNNWNEAKKNKNYELADKLREQLINKNII